MAIWLALPAVLLSLWASALARRGGWRRHLRWVPLVCGVAWLGGCVTAYLLIETFDHIQRSGLAPSERQRMLSEGIARSMWPSLVELCLFLGVFVVLLVAQIGRGSAEYPTALEPKGDTNHEG